ncbi:hypothetical protein GUJ93_ZPchr0006g44747 [Zizania palustris]|uniref:Phytocyanin domain-containing protein n=1 Tax=Zizania palustris TaxID=103762 RepID=A0A8J5TB07_ZIZPA|nr:hypothetical protein GUJ93_ZPchr0006g44747 [Zizania palustris]
MHSVDASSLADARRVCGVASRVTLLRKRRWIVRIQIGARNSEFPGAPVTLSGHHRCNAVAKNKPTKATGQVFPDLTRRLIRSNATVQTQASGTLVSIFSQNCNLNLQDCTASATQFRVGGGRGWSVPDANAEPYNSWAGRMRFQIGDQLLFVYPKETDAVLVVDQGAYDACNTSAFAGRFDDGSTVFTFDRSGPFFFISGSEANCRAGEKLVVVVMADRSGSHTPPAPPLTPMPSPASSPPSPAMMPPSLAPSPPGVVACDDAPELSAVSGSSGADPVILVVACTLGFTYPFADLSTISGSFCSCPCSNDSELATGSGGHGSITVVCNPRRRATAAACLDQPAARHRGSERDHAVAAYDQRSERRGSGGGRPRDFAGSLHRLRHGSYLKSSAVTFRLIQYRYCIEDLSLNLFLVHCWNNNSE